MPDDVYKFPTMSGVESGAIPLDQRQFLTDMNRLSDAPVYLNGQLAEIVKLELPVPFRDSPIDGSKMKCGLVFKDGHTEYATIKQINVITSAELRIDIITEEPPERAPQ